MCKMLLATCFLHVYRYSMHLLFFCERVTPPFTLPALGTFPARGSRTGTTKPKSKTASQVETSAPSGIDLDCLVVRLRVCFSGCSSQLNQGLRCCCETPGTDCELAPGKPSKPIQCLGLGCRVSVHLDIFDVQQKPGSSTSETP